jgi:hypothetical protein
LFDAIDAMQQTQVCAYKCVAVKFSPENNMIFGNFAAGAVGHMSAYIFCVALQLPGEGTGNDPRCRK